MARKLTFKFPEELFGSSFLPYLECLTRIQLFTGNRGSGKTTFLQQKAIIFALTKKYFRLIYTRKVSENIRDSLFQGFKDIIHDWSLEKYFKIKESEMDIICIPTGNMLLSFGLDKPEKLKGIKDPTHILCDEMTEITFQDYSALIALLRTSKTAITQFWGTFNPEYGFWGRDYFFADSESDEIPLGVVPSKGDDVIIIKGSFKHNQFIDAVAYEKLLLELARGDENKLTVWIEGNWGQSITGNEYFTEYKKSVHAMQVPFLADKAVHVTFDFNTVPYMTLLGMQVNITAEAFEIRVFREYCLKSPLNSTTAVCKKFLEDYTPADLLYYGDASGENNIAGKGNVTAFDDVRIAFFHLITDASNRVLKRNPPILKRRDFMNDILGGRLKYEGLPILLMIDESCKELLKDMLKLKMGADGKKLKVKVKDKASGISYEELGHTSDALEYMIVQLLWDEFSKKQNK
ncbi:MAG: hypothetical protein GXC72_00795 [Chitinophagaceae bacterium]|nr:hypothetical protein [Chitinophagaceae bacterium]